MISGMILENADKQGSPANRSARTYGSLWKATMINDNYLYDLQSRCPDQLWSNSSLISSHRTIPNQCVSISCRVVWGWPYDSFKSHQIGCGSHILSILPCWLDLDSSPTCCPNSCDHTRLSAVTCICSIRLEHCFPLAWSRGAWGGSRGSS